MHGVGAHTPSLPLLLSSGSPLQMDFSCTVIIIINLGDRSASEQLKTHLLQCQAEAAAGGEEGGGGHSHADESTDESENVDQSDQSDQSRLCN